MALTLKQDFSKTTLAAAALTGPTLTFARASGASYFDSGGVLQEASSGTARLASHTYNGTSWVNRGVLIEEARTNLFLASASLDKADINWADGGVTQSIDEGAPDGSTDANLMGDDTAGTSEYVFQDVAISSSTDTYCYSVFVKKDATATNAPHMWIDMLGGTLDYGRMALDLTDGSTVERSGLAPDASGSEDCGDWYRFWMTLTAVSNNTSIRCRFYPAAEVLSTANGIEESAVIDDCIVWGAQLEAGSFPTSYIPTTTASVTRSADVLDTSDVTWLDSADSEVGTMVCAGYMPQDTDVSRRVWHLDDGGNSDRIYCTFASNDRFGLNSQTNTADTECGIAAAAWSPGAPSEFEVACAWADDDCGLSQSGETAVNDTSATFPVADSLTNLRVGMRSGDIEQICGFIKHLRYYNTRQTNGWLESPDPFDAGGSTNLLLLGVG